MNSTAGTIGRITALMGLLIGIWFGGFTALYALLVMIVGVPFGWSDAGLGFALLMAARMFYPRNVFKW